MSIITKPLLTLAAIASITALPVANAQASDLDRAYIHDATIGYTAPDWMAGIADDSPLTTISIPGTHDTMSTGPGGDATQNQSMSLATQLESGIRFLDIRLRKIQGDNQLYLHHGPAFLNATVDDVVTTVSEFLTQHPSETVLMRVKQEYSEVPAEEFATTLREHLEPFADQLWRNTNDLGVATPLEELRTKMVLLNENFSDLVPWGMAYDDASSIQDDYHLTTISNQYDKWLAAKEQLNNAQVSGSHNGNTLFLNYLSGSGGALPYFVASGKVGPATNANQLSTGFTTPGFESTYPDFPRTSCFIGMCTISYEGTNQLAANHIQSTELKNIGIVIADFPGPALIKTIVDSNH